MRSSKNDLPFCKHSSFAFYHFCFIIWKPVTLREAVPFNLEDAFNIPLQIPFEKKFGSDEGRWAQKGHVKWFFFSDFSRNIDRITNFWQKPLLHCMKKNFSDFSRNIDRITNFWQNLCYIAWKYIFLILAEILTG